MKLTDEEKRILDGEQGEPGQVAMRILSKFGELNGAECLVPIASAHLVACSYQIAGEAGIEIYGRLVKQGARVAVPTTLDPGSIDFKRWKEFKTPAQYAGRQILLAELLSKMGVIPTWSCTPYYLLNVPRFGQDLAWSESSAVAFVNSVIGARTNRMSAYIDLCAAILGKVPKFGLHLQENRGGQIHIELDRELADAFSDFHFPVLGYFVGQIAADKIPVITGLKGASFDQLKAFGAAAAASGSVALYHMVGITPEARTIEEAFLGRKPERRIRVGREEIHRTLESMRTFDGGTADVVSVGCPHASIDQMRLYAELLDNRKVHEGVQLWVCTNEIVEEIARKMGYLETIERAGARIMVGTCLNDCPLDAWNFKHLITDSGKFTYYTPTTVGTECFYTDTRSCIEAAIKGRIE
jgi:predicted aconitase